ncbi:hypothetical protein E3Q13_03564 [Wallemia mellicola]|nr:hypothetical protein E3Q13_03564 [Wallemia mellicola]
MTDLKKILTPNAVFAVAKRTWGYDMDFYSGSSVRTAIANKQPRLLSADIPIYSSRVTIYQNTNADTLYAKPVEYPNEKEDDDDKNTLVDDDASLAEKDAFDKDDLDDKSVLEDDTQPVFEMNGKHAVTTAYRSKYMRSKYTVEVIGYDKPVTLERGSHYLSIKKKFELGDVQYMVFGKKNTIFIKNVKTDDVICTFDIPRMSKRKAGVLRLSMSGESSLYERLAVLSVMIVEVKFIYELLHASWEGAIYAGIQNGMAKATSSKNKY